MTVLRKHGWEKGRSICQQPQPHVNVSTVFQSILLAVFVPSSLTTNFDVCLCVCVLSYILLVCVCKCLCESPGRSLVRARSGRHLILLLLVLLFSTVCVNAALLLYFTVPLLCRFLPCIKSYRTVTIKTHRHTHTLPPTHSHTTPTLGLFSVALDVF